MPKRRDLLRLAGLGPLAFLPAVAAPIANKVVPAKDAKLTKEPFGDILIYFDGATDLIKSMTAGSLRLKAGMEPHPPHQHPEEEFLLFTEGTGEVSIEGKVTQVAPGSMIYCAGNKIHGVRAGKTPLLLYFYKWKV